MLRGATGEEIEVKHDYWEAKIPVGWSYLMLIQVCRRGITLKVGRKLARPSFIIIYKVIGLRETIVGRKLLFCKISKIDEYLFRIDTY